MFGQIIPNNLEHIYCKPHACRWQQLGEEKLRLGEQKMIILEDIKTLTRIRDK